MMKLNFVDSATYVNCIFHKLLSDGTVENPGDSFPLILNITVYGVCVHLPTDFFLPRLHRHG